MRRGTPLRPWCGLALLWLCGALHAQEPAEGHAPENASRPAAAAVPGSESLPTEVFVTEGPAPAARAVDEPAAAPTEPKAEAPPFDSGVASWYGDRFHGRTTASGEPFDMHALTAAHPTLPFGSIVRVRSLVNNRVVDVRINDRGPYAGGRIIDLSRAAAAVLGLIQMGTKPVQLNLLQGGLVERTTRARRYFNARRSSPPVGR